MKTKSVNPLFAKLSTLILAITLFMSGAVNMKADAEYALWTNVSSESVSKQVDLTISSTTSTYNVVKVYTLDADQGPNTKYDHAILRLPYSDLSSDLGTSVTSSNISNMIYYPLTNGSYAHKGDNWFDVNGYRSSWGGDSHFFIQEITDDASNFIFWVGQAGSYNNAYLSQVGDHYSSTFYMINGSTALEFHLTLNIVEAFPVNVSLSDISIEDSKVIELRDYISTNTSNPTTNVSGIACANVPNVIGLPISSFTEDMMYAPLNDNEICRTKIKTSGKAFWYENVSGTPGMVYDQTTWNASTARTFVNIEGFYNTNNTLKFGYGQYCGNTQAGTYIMKVYMLGSKNSSGKYKAYEVEIRLTLEEKLVDDWVHIPETSSIVNIRDLGGWTNSRGETIQYGKLFRGTELNGDKYNINDADKSVLYNDLGIRAELDLRTHAQAHSISVSPLGSDVTYLRVVNEPFYLDGARSAFANYRSDFNFILENLRANNPVYFHCIWGADRTGTLAFLLEGMLGLSESDLYKEYEITKLSNPEGDVRTQYYLEPLMNYIKTFDGNTLQEKFINYWHQHVHIPMTDINDFCQIMLGTTTDYVGSIPEAMDNLAYDCTEVEASYTATWVSVYSIYDGLVGFGELDNTKAWHSFKDNGRPSEEWLRYGWSGPQRAERVRVFFWSDTETAGDHVALPSSWKVQYWDSSNNIWKDVVLLPGESYTQSRNEVSSVRFEPVETTQMRLVMEAQGNGSSYSALGVVEWEVLGERLNGDIVIGDYPIQNVDFSKVNLTDQFWNPRMEQNQSVTIPVAIDQCYSTNRVLNFQKAAAILRGENIGYFDTECTFDDTDIYKILEGMAYSVQAKPNAALSAKMDELIEIIGAAQEPDGYLYTARTAGNPSGMHGWVGANRWEKDPDLSHELYNAGHLYEAAAAHYISTGKTSLLDIATKNADLLVKDFLYGGLTYEPGHQIVEMGLVKLYRVTGNEDYLKLAKYFLDLRGTRGVMRQEYSQTHKPVIMQDEAVGHAVRAAYMYSGMADIAALMHDASYLNAIDKIWENVASKKYYINGGIGARHAGESFGSNYELPNQSAYCETCAAIANVYWNWRMFLLHGESKYYDIIERTLYNGVISGINLDGNRFFYPNPLASDGNGWNGRSAEREAWFGCACCPSNLCRFIASVPGYIYAHKDNKVYVNLYVQGNADIDMGSLGVLRLTQTTDYPWDGSVKVTIDQPINSACNLMLRLPGWANGQPVPSDLYSYVDGSHNDIVVKVNGSVTSYTMIDGYMSIERSWSAGDEITFEFPMEVRHTIAHANVADDEGLVEIERGPIVYCMEDKDNSEDFNTYIANDEATASVIDSNINGYNFKGISLEGQRLSGEGVSSATINLVPYYAWNNRGRGNMQIWMPRTSAKASFEAYPVTVNMNNLTIVGSQTIDIDYYPVSDDWATHRVSGLAAGGDVPTLIETPMSNFSLNMMYAPSDANTLNRTKNADNGKGFWYGKATEEPGTIYNIPQWTGTQERIFMNIEGFYNANQTVSLGYGQRPDACVAGTYIAPLYMLAPTDNNGNHKAYEFLFRFNLRPSEINEDTNYSLENDKIRSARLTRTLKPGIHNTLVLPFSLTKSQASAMFGEGTTMEQITAYEDGVLKTEEINSSTPNQPFLLLPSNVSSDNTYLFNHIQLTGGDASVKSFTNGSLVGSYNGATTVSASTESGKDNYIISNDRFYLVAENSGTMKGTRAYLVLTTPAGGAKQIVPFNGDDITGISEIASKELDAEVYDLQGRKIAEHMSDSISNLPSGIYIVNNKKVIINNK